MIGIGAGSPPRALDTPTLAWQVRAMSTLTRLILLLSVLALLPLGSFAAKFGTSPRIAGISAHFDDTATSPQRDTPALSPAATEKTFASAHGRCKGPSLPGSPCDPALAIWPTDATLAFTAAVTTLHPTAWPPMIGHNPPHRLGPPRLG